MDSEKLRVIESVFRSKSNDSSAGAFRSSMKLEALIAEEGGAETVGLLKVSKAVVFVMLMYVFQY